MERNLWMCDRHGVASWYMRFPKTTGERHIEAMLRFADALLQAGEAEQIYRVERLDAPGSHSNQWYADYMRSTWEQTGTLPFFTNGWPLFEKREYSRICYWGMQNEIVEAEVDNVGQLVHELHPEHRIGAWADNRPPVEIWSSSKVQVIEEHEHQPYIGLSVNICTDIWFPKIVGWLSEALDYRHSPETMYDNRPLALCHTPHLNRFIERVYDLARDAGAEWMFEPGDYAGDYRYMLHDKGIRLDI